MGCGSSQPKVNSQSSKVSGNDDRPIETITVPEWVNAYPPPTPPLQDKADIFDERQWEEKDRKSASVPSNFDSYESLLEALAGECESDMNTARAIFVWLFHQDILDNNYHGVTDPNTPRGYMKLIKMGEGTYESFFTLLCRAANIPCAIVQGIGKGDDYIVGQNTTEGMGSTCNAVYLNGSWRLLHIGWAYLNEKLNHADPESENNQVMSKGTKRSRINEFFWLTDPSKMINFCFPNDKSWQLLKCPRDLNLFLQSPQFTEDYFTSSMSVSNGLKAIIVSKHGLCTVKFEHPQTDVSSIKISGRLRKQVSALKSVDSLNNFVITTGRDSCREIFIRFPEEGIYYLDVYGDVNNNLSLITKFRLDCMEVHDPVYPFPLQPENGFVVLPNVKDFGILSIKPTDCVIYVKPKSITEFQLTLSQDVHIDAKMFHVNKNLGTLDQFLEVVNDLTKGLAWVKVAIPDTPNVEYALQGKLLTVVEVADDTRRKLQEATKAGDLGALEKAIHEFKSSGQEDQGDLTKALNVLFLMNLDNLRAATCTRKFKEISSAIATARKSILADVIERTQEMEDARSAQQELLSLKLILHKILELKPRTISEIHSYPRPRILVHNVMKATYRILGEPDENVQSWPAVKALMKEIGLNSIINRIKRFDIFYLTNEEAEDAETYLSQTSRQSVRVVSAGAGTFYTWSKNVLGQYQTLSREMRSRKTTQLSLIY